MFGGPTATATPPPSGGRPQAANVAKIQGNLTHVIVAGPDPDDLHVFYNGQWVMTGQVESIGVEIIAPATETDSGTITGVLTRVEEAADGTRQSKALSLFPGTVEFIAANRRICVVCPEAGSFNNLALLFGTADENGVINNIGLPANGVQSLRIVISSGLIDGKMVWGEDGREDKFLP